MFRPEDISQLECRGISIDEVIRQIENFKKGFPYLRLTEPATTLHGIKRLTENEILYNCAIFDQKINEGHQLIKFVPASGAASRMFKPLYEALDELKKGKSQNEIMQSAEIEVFLKNLKHFAFYDDLKLTPAFATKTPDEAPIQQILESVLYEHGLNYGNLPKGLLKFHQYVEGNRTSMEEHLAEGALYCINNRREVSVHFTVSDEHLSAFRQKTDEIKDQFEHLLGVKYHITYSLQKPSTDTIAVNLSNEPFRNQDGSLLFRPAGHGALLENLNELDADLIFVKNIDNVVPDHLKSTTVTYKKALAGLLLKFQEQIFRYQQILDEHRPNTLESTFYAEATGFLENILLITPPDNQYYSEKEELYYYLKQKFNRPIRVCGMVKNLGEAGGGPFLARNRDGSVSLQIVESSQIDFSNAEQANIAHHASHFNPVDLVCGVKNYLGQKYDLLKFRDPNTGFISRKSKDGKELKSQELPGLWNGSMADWNTIFVEVPIGTFAPVKSVNDLLRKEHQ